MAILPDEAPTAVLDLPTQLGAHRAARRTRLRDWLRRAWRRPRVRDGLALGSFLLAGVWVLGHLAIDPAHRVLAANVNDQAFFEWVLANGARVLTHGANPFVSNQLGAPNGVNMMANTSILGLSLPMAPITLLFGVRVSFLVLLIVGMAATGCSWYLMLTRKMRLARGPAYLGAALCGFGPALVAHANGHPNIVAQFLIPWLIWHVLALARGARPVRTGLILAALVVWQFFINEELLFITALTFAIFGAAWLAQRPTGWRRSVRRLVGGLAVTAAVTVPLLAYPLFVQFFGPQHYHGLMPRIHDFGADLASFGSFASESIGGNPATSGHVAQNAAEENTFFGIPLLLVAGFFFWYLWRRPAVRALAVAAAVLAFFSLGIHIRVRGRLTGLPGPYDLIRSMPLLDSVVPTRLALAITPILGILLALGCAQLFPALARAGTGPVGVPVRALVGVLLAAALITVAPTPIPAVGGTPVPGFISSGEWREYVPAGMSLVTVPLPQPYNVQPMRWSALTGDELRLAGGYFLGPSDDPKDPDDRRAVFAPSPRPSEQLWQDAAQTGDVPPIGRPELAQFRVDLAYWHAAVLVLSPGHQEEALWKTLLALVGRPPAWVGGVWVWDVRDLR